MPSDSTESIKKKYSKPRGFFWLLIMGNDI